MRRSDVLVIDICGTLYRSNTTYDMLDYYFHNEFKYKIFVFLRKCKVSSFLNSVIFHFFHIDIMRNIGVCFFKGYNVDKLHEMVEEFFKNYLSHRKNVEVFAVIEKYRKYSKLISVSATLDCIGDFIAEENGFDKGYSTRLAYRNNICCGKIEEDLLGDKSKIIKREIRAKFDVITDNYSDVDIIKMSSKAYLVQYKNQKNKWYHCLAPDILKKCVFIYV